MEAIEFNTVLHNGTIQMPKAYSRQWEGKVVRVILLAAPDDQTPLAVELPPAAIAGEDAVIAPDDEPPAPSSLLSRLKQIKISAPPDFSENLDAYLNGEQHV